jgi:hypothetical protein
MGEGARFTRPKAGAGGSVEEERGVLNANAEGRGVRRIALRAGGFG